MKKDKKAKRKIKARNHLKHKITEHIGLMRKVRKQAILEKLNEKK